MLVLSRHRNESLMVGDDVKITIIEIRGDTVRLGINAPRSVPVHRGEVYAAIQRERARKVGESDGHGHETTGEQAEPGNAG